MNDVIGLFDIHVYANFLEWLHHETSRKVYIQYPKLKLYLPKDIFMFMSLHVIGTYRSTTEMLLSLTPISTYEIIILQKPMYLCNIPTYKSN